MQFRIGKRDPVTGMYNVIYPDGSSTPNGIKIYNAEHQAGDIVSATKRGDGMVILDNPKAADPSSLTVSAAGNRDGYLSGQIFNVDEEQKNGRILTINYDYSYYRYYNHIAFGSDTLLSSATLAQINQLSFNSSSESLPRLFPSFQLPDIHQFDLDVVTKEYCYFGIWLSQSGEYLSLDAYNNPNYVFPSITDLDYESTSVLMSPSVDRIAIDPIAPIPFYYPYIPLIKQYFRRNNIYQARWNDIANGVIRNIVLSEGFRVLRVPKYSPRQSAWVESLPATEPTSMRPTYTIVNRSYRA